MVSPSRPDLKQRITIGLSKMEKNGGFMKIVENKHDKTMQELLAPETNIISILRKPIPFRNTTTARYP